MFPLTSYGIAGGFTITGVNFSIEQPFGSGTIMQANGISVEVGTYTGTVGSASLDNTDITWLASTSADVAAGSSPRAVSASLVPTAIAAGATIIVAIGVPSYAATGAAIGVGGTADGEMLPSYFTAPMCNLPTPVDTDSNFSPAKSVGDFIIDVVGHAP